MNNLKREIKNVFAYRLIIEIARGQNKALLFPNFVGFRVTGVIQNGKH